MSNSLVIDTKIDIVATLRWDAKPFMAPCALSRHEPRLYFPLLVSQLPEPISLEIAARS